MKFDGIIHEISTFYEIRDTENILFFSDISMGSIYAAISVFLMPICEGSRRLSESFSWDSLTVFEKIAVEFSY